MQKNMGIMIKEPTPQNIQQSKLCMYLITELQTLTELKEETIPQSQMEIF